MKDRLSDEQNEEILKSLNEAIDTGPWDKSNFLKVVGKNLIEIRDGFLNQLGASSRAQLKAESHLANRIALRSGQQEIYISLYSSDGAVLQSWEKIISNLPKQMISRPIYADEADIKALLKTKENKQNEAYVAVYINQSDILSLSADKAPVDKLGKMLLSLKDKTLNLDNISRFVHVSGVYKFERNRLIKMP
ncbi:Dot/Icm secretion system protein IcmQ [Legionella worsleiensis]|uniref:IcmQ n=1 Tax=Legionella worsleiensis TaxID=45076 RepID=Q49JB7_9GAMM|nr:Dot/Icm secretion system protein IcmQ [Legionella worsleiensis]AAX56159.1 IcmQ [Legionella worsleiensis]KTD81713.1 IcmQ protein [Legionella worsleiensis]STY31877.1 IcmQ protein [Legionella worsleiensis]